MIMSVCLQYRTDEPDTIEIVFFKDDGSEEKFYFTTKDELYNFLKTRG